MNWVSLLILVFMASPFPVFSQEKDPLNVVSEEWEGATNKDGSGFYFDLLREIYTPEKMKVSVQVMPYKRGVILVEKQVADLWIASYLNEEDFAIYPQWHFDKDKVAVIFRKDQVSEWQGEKSLTGKRIGWIRGYHYDEYFKVNVTKNEVNSRQSGFKMLELERLDFFADDSSELDLEIQRSRFDMTKFRKEVLFKLNLYMAFQKTIRGQNLAGIWDKRIKALHESGQLKAFYKKYAYTDYPFD
ncbi:transporter substrate-binding domain-containing protein [Deltaproteobacteria bacterium TL4]